MSDTPPELPRLNPPAPLAEAGDTPTGPRELFVRHARKDGRTVALLRAIDYGDACVVEAHVFAQGAATPTFPGPYTFGDAHDATAFVTDAVEALMYLGCEIAAQ
jgi:hypothetical protein